MKILTIKRSKWLTGSKNNSYLLRPKDGKMCCLGFFALQKCGATKEDIRGKREPYDTTNVSWYKKLWSSKRNTGHDYTTDLCQEMMEVNDARMPSSERETKLRLLFRKIGITLRFVD